MSSSTLTNSVLQEWKDFDLEGKRNDLDTQASTITEVREESLASRKKLAATTREFKKLPADEKMRGVGALLKDYQQEIDKLTQRCKGAESAFLELYTSLQKLTDPCVGLNAATEEMHKASSAGRLELENKNLRSQLEQYQQEFKDIKNQEVTIRRLQDQVKEYEGRMDSLVEEKMQENSTTIQTNLQSTIDQMQEREENLTHQLEQTKNELTRVVQQNSELQNQILSEKSYFDEKYEAKQDELEYMAEEINRVTSENERMKRDLARAKQEAQDLRSGAQNEKDLLQIQELESKVTQRELELADTREQLHDVKDTLDLERTSHQQILLQVKNELLLEKEQSERLSQQLADAPSKEKHAKLKQKIAMLKGIEGLGSGDDSNASVETLLQQKNRRLETQIVQSKEALADKEKENEQLQVKFDALTEKAKQQKAQIQKLEEDLLQGYATQAQGGALEDSGASTALPRTDSMLKIVCSQRDRVQSKLQKTEESKEQLQSQLQTLSSELTSLRSDNVKLYQKIQYLENYNSKRSTRSQDLEAGVVENKYKPLYEESVNPFADFNRRERHSRYKQLNAADRVTLTMGDWFLSNRYSRVFILVYTLVLHLFIFVMMYHFANIPTHCPVPE